jgi:tetratricopeptide (TPR) repeat protein
VANPSQTTPTQSELREPDAFQKAGAPVAAWLVARQKLMMALAGLVLLGLLGAAIYSSLKGRGERQAAQELGKTLEVLNRPVEGEPSPDAIPGKAPFKNVRERDEALRQELTAFRSAHSGTPSALTALLPLAQVEQRLGNHDAALGHFDGFLSEAAKDEPLRASALEGKGYSLEAKGQLDQAVAAFEELEALKREEFLTGMGAFHRARLLLVQGKQEEGVKALQQVAADHAKAAAGRLANERLKVLASQGVAIPPAPAPAAAPAAPAAPSAPAEGK